MGSSVGALLGAGVGGVPVGTQVGAGLGCDDGAGEGASVRSTSRLGAVVLLPSARGDASSRLEHAHVTAVGA